MSIIYNLTFLLLFQFSFVRDLALEFPPSSPLTASQGEQKSDKTGAANIVFKSIDGGQTWQDISEGLPENGEGDDFFANESGLYLHAGNQLFHSKPNSTAQFWEKEIFVDEHNNFAPGKTGIFAYNYYDGHVLKQTNGTSLWSPINPNFEVLHVRTVFETSAGTVFIGSDYGLFKSGNGGKTWKQVHTGGWAMKVVESNGIFLATSQRGIIRSINEGETWDLVISEGGVGIAVEPIQGGFAAITYNTMSATRRVRTSYDGGKTWLPIDADLPASKNIASIIQVGEYFLCGHPSGILRSSDKGYTWKLVVPSIGDQVFNLFVSGNVIYAIPRAGGC